jgi:hypothetical protein
MPHRPTGHGHDKTMRRKTMNHESDDDLIELGAVTDQTRGMPWGVDDHQGLLYVPAGLSAE